MVKRGLWMTVMGQYIVLFSLYPTLKNTTLKTSMMSSFFFFFWKYWTKTEQGYKKRKKTSYYTFWKTRIINWNINLQNVKTSLFFLTDHEDFLAHKRVLKVYFKRTIIPCCIHEVVIWDAGEMWTEKLTFLMSDGRQGKQLLFMTNPYP